MGLQGRYDHHSAQRGNYDSPLPRPACDGYIQLTHTLTLPPQESGNARA